MDIAESIGFQHFWSFVPAQSFIDEGVENVFVTGAGDLGHVLKSLGDLARMSIQPRINIYIHDTQESVARAMMQLLIINEMHLPIRERVELFLEVYGNALVKEKAEQQIDDYSKELINILTEHRATAGVKELMDFTNLKFKQRDDVEEVLRSWQRDVPFETAVHRDTRLRYHFKDRYDFRVNLMDWDYNFYIKKLTNLIHWYHYKEFRQSGVSFENRLAKYTSPNRTLASYIPGKTKKDRNSCLVRGFWADIVQTPYWSFGTIVDCCAACNEIFFRTANQQQVYNTQDISDYNVTRIVTMLETMADYHFPPENDRYKKMKKQWSGEEPIEEIKEEEEEEEAVREIPTVLPGLANVKFNFIMDPIEAICKRSKFQGMFNRLIIGANGTGKITADLNRLCAPECQIGIELFDNIIVLKDEQKQEVTKQFEEVTQAAGWIKLSEDNGFGVYSL